MLTISSFRRLLLRAGVELIDGRIVPCQLDIEVADSGELVGLRALADPGGLDLTGLVGAGSVEAIHRAARRLLAIGAN